MQDTILATSGNGELAALYFEEGALAGGMHVHPEYQLFLALKGRALEARYERDDGALRTLAHERGTAHLIAPDQPHGFAGSSVEMVSLFFSRRVMDQVAEDVVGRTFGSRDWYGLDDPFLLRLGASVRDHILDQGAFNRTFADSICYIAAASIAQRLARRVMLPSTAATIGDRRLRSACEFIEEHLGEELTVDAIAATVGLSPYHFLRIFRVALGRPPHRYIVERRVERARERLAHTRDAVSEIAFDLGFSSASHLSTAFRRRYGLSPVDYRHDFGDSRIYR